MKRYCQHLLCTENQRKPHSAWVSAEVSAPAQVILLSCRSVPADTTWLSRESAKGEGSRVPSVSIQVFLRQLRQSELCSCLCEPLTWGRCHVDATQEHPTLLPWCHLLYTQQGGAVKAVTAAALPRTTPDPCFWNAAIWLALFSFLL